MLQRYQPRQPCRVVDESTCCGVILVEVALLHSACRSLLRQNRQCSTCIITCAVSTLTFEGLLSWKESKCWVCNDVSVAIPNVPEFHPGSINMTAIDMDIIVTSRRQDSNVSKSDGSTCTIGLKHTDHGNTETSVNATSVRRRVDVFQPNLPIIPFHIQGITPSMRGQSSERAAKWDTSSRQACMAYPSFYLPGSDVDHRGVAAKQWVVVPNSQSPSMTTICMCVSRWL